MAERRYDIDWLRVLAMLAVFLFHTTRFFDTEGWHLKNAEQSFVLFVAVRGLMWPWLMELFFLLSGVGAWYLLRSRSTGKYILDRVKRLLVPLFTVGVFVLLPIQYYFDMVTKKQYDGGFWELMPRYLQGFDWPRLTSWPDTILNIPFEGHLWFLSFLFLVSLAVLPILLFLKSERGLRWIDVLARLCEKKAGIFVFLIPLMFTLVVLRRVFPVERGWAEFVWYALYFLIGYLLPADSRFTVAFQRYKWIGLPMWLVGFFGGIAALVLGAGYNPTSGVEPFSLNYLLFQTIWAIASWGAIVFLLGIGTRYLGFSNQTLVYGNEAVLPFYLFHQTILLGVGFFILPLNLGILSKLLIILALSFVAIMVPYELIVRRSNVTRVLFGMKPIVPKRS